MSSEREGVSVLGMIIIVVLFGNCAVSPHMQKMQKDITEIKQMVQELKGDKEVQVSKTKVENHTEQDKGITGNPVQLPSQPPE